MREIDQQLLSRSLAAVRKNIPSCAWGSHADAIAADRFGREQHLRRAEEDIDRSLFGQLDAFRCTGVLQLPTGLSQDRATAIRGHLETLPVHRGPHTLSGVCRQRPLEQVRQESSMAGYSMDQLLRTPSLIDVFNRPDIVDFLELYFGCVPTLYSLNAWWSFPARAPELVNVQFFHRDTDDWRFCTLFLYLTDVDLFGGPHQVIRGSHTFPGMQRLIDHARHAGRDVETFDIGDTFVNHFGEEFSRRCEDLFQDSLLNLTGPAGTMSLVNTIALHRGLLPSETPRLVIWARYGLGPNSNSADMEQGPLCRFQLATDLDDTPRNRYVNRLLFEFDRGPEYR